MRHANIRRTPIILAAMAALILAIAGFALLHYPAEAQDGSAPARPTNLATRVSTDQVVLTWDNPWDKTITGYVIERRERQTNSQGTFAPIEENTGSTDTTFTDNTVEPSRKYVYRIKAINAAGLSEISSWARAHTPPAKPTGLSATASHDQVALTWNDPGDDAINGYVILRRIPGVDPKGQFSELASNTGTAALTYTDNTVSAETRYTYRIKAINEHGTSERSRWVHIDTPAAPEPETDPADLAPTSLAAELTSGQVVLSWDPPAEDAGSVTGYEILRGEGEDEPATLAADTGSAAATYTDTTATTASQSYAYSVKAIRDSERSQASNETVVQLPPAVPTGVLSAAAHDRVMLSWNDPQDGAITGYRILRADVVDGVPGEFATLIADTDSGDTGSTDTAVEPETSYVYRVLAINPGGASEPSHDVEVRTTTPVAPQEPLRTEPANVSEGGADCPHNTTTTCEVDMDGSATGNIETEIDRDWFKVELETGTRYQMDLEGAPTGRGTLPDPLLAAVADPDGNFISSSGSQDGGVGLNGRTIFTPTADGAHYVVAAANGATGTYTLSVIVLGAKGSSEADTDFPAATATTGRVEVGASATGNIGNNDIDWFRVDLETGRQYQIDMEGADTGRGTLADPNLSLHGGAGNAIVNDDDSGTDLNSQIVYTATETGPHYLRAGPAPTGTGTYTLSVRETTPSDAEQRPAEQQGIQGAFRLNPDIQEDYEDQTQDRYSGKQSRLEVFHSNRWGTVCSDRFRGSGNTDDPSHGNLAPGLACQAMGYDNGEYLPGYGSSEAHQPEADQDNYVRPGGTYPASGPLPIWIDDLMCWTRAEWKAQTRPAGEEETPEFLRLMFLEDPDKSLEVPENQGRGTPYVCAYAGWGLHNGTHQEDAGLRCWYNSQQSAQQAGKSLTVQMSSAPARHDGSHPVRVKITFSEPVDETSETLQTHSIQVDGGEVSAVQPENSQTTPGARSVGKETQNKVVWIVDIRPNTTEEMTIRLEGRLPCEEAAAICTADGRTLSEGISTTVPGPSSLPTEPPARPTGLIGAATHDSISLIWDDPSDSSITGYVILRRIPGVDPEGQFSELVSNTGTDATTYTDDTVSAETRYTYRIKAINGRGVSQRSRWLHIDTPAAPASQQSSEEDAPGPTTTEPADGDFAASAETTAQVGVGQSIVGRIGAAGDVDWILVEADPGQWFTIALTGYGEGDHAALETPYQQAYHLPDGSVMSPEYALNKGRPPCSAGCTHVEVSQGSSRYVAVASLTEGNTGSYQLTVTLERTNEGADMAADVGTRGFLRMLTPEEFPGFNLAWNRVRGQITPGDTDWYRIDLEAGRAYRFGLRQSNTDLRLRLRDSTGTVIDSIGSGRAIHAAACAEGSHYIEIYRPDAAALATTNYVVQAAYTDGLETAALRSILLNAGQVQLDWQCYGIADSHQVQFRLDGQWTTLSADDDNPADIQLDYLNGGHTGKTAGLPTGDEYADYEFRIARVVDGVATTDYREVSVVVIPDTPRNLRGGWDLRYYPDALTFEWNAVKGDNVFYEVQVKDQEDEEWIDLEKGAEPPAGLIHQEAGKTRVKILAASPRYVSDARLWETGNEHVTVRVRANQYDKVSPWSRAFDVLLAEMLWVAVGTRDGAMTGPGQATLTWGAPYYSGPGAFRPTTTHVMHRMDGEWLHLLPGHDVNGVAVAVESGRAVVSGLPTGLQEYKFSIRHLGRHVPNNGTSLLILSAWSRTITITTDLATPARPEATQTGDNQVSVNWQPVADATQYRLRLWTVDRWEELDGEDDGGVSVTMSGTTATVSGLPSDYHWYIFEVQALGPNGVQQSAWSPNAAVFNQHRPGG